MAARFHPIATAPTDGTEVLGYAEPWGWVRCRYVDGYWMVGDMAFRPTHWLEIDERSAMMI